jgi:uncharacterized membrane protein YraQ (UPF0718 family)
MAQGAENPGGESPIGEFVRLFGSHGGVSAKGVMGWALLGVLIFGLMQMFLRWGNSEIEL